MLPRKHHVEVARTSRPIDLNWQIQKPVETLTITMLKTIEYIHKLKLTKKKIKIIKNKITQHCELLLNREKKTKDILSDTYPKEKTNK